jgi:uracil-DNA glycosylase
MNDGYRCRYFSCCPLRRFEESGEIGETYKRRFCEGEFEKCVRFKMEEKGMPHPDRLMPDGKMLDGD